MYWNRFKYLSINADDPLPRGGAMFKLNAMDSIAQGYFPHSDQVIRHPERSSVTARRTEKCDIYFGRPKGIFRRPQLGCTDFNLLTVSQIYDGLQSNQHKLNTR